MRFVRLIARNECEGESEACQEAEAATTSTPNGKTPTERAGKRTPIRTTTRKLARTGKPITPNDAGRRPVGLPGLVRS